MTLDIERLLAGRPLALDRSALEPMAARALAKAGSANQPLERLRSASVGGRGRIATQRIGSTAVIPLTGMITSDPFLAWLFDGTNPDELIQALREATADTSVSDILLICDSPGGEVSLIPETAAQIRQFRAVKPITALARPTMASAAFWLASQATSVVATPSADVGAVGVFMCHVDQSGLNARLGLSVTYIASSPAKVELNSDSPLSNDALAHVQANVDAVFGQFVNDLALGRRTSQSSVRSQFGDGRTFGASEALRRGMVDRVGTLESVLATSSGGRSSVRAFAQADDQASIDEELSLLATMAADR